jgi:Ca-activated chloride channel family protein
MKLRICGLLILAALAGCGTHGVWTRAENCPEAPPNTNNRRIQDEWRRDRDKDEVWVIEKPVPGFVEVPPQDDDIMPPRGGELRCREPGRDRVVILPLRRTDVRAQITLHVGAVQVKQQYTNPYGEKIEAVYVFPLPENAAVRDFVMQIGDRRIRGIIREREEARQIYREARRQGHVASLLTQERPNIFTQSVANIEPGRWIDIEITYFHSLKYNDGQYEFWFPMVVGPRYKAEVPVEYQRPDEISHHDISVEVDIDAGMKIEEFVSPTHSTLATRVSDSRLRVQLDPKDRIPNKDFVLRYRVAGKAPKAAIATYRDERGGFFTLMLHAPQALEDIPATPREMIFVLDCSGSMKGEPLAKAKKVLQRCLKRLGPNDTFQVIRFSDSASSLGRWPIEASDENVRRALRYVEGLDSEGGTNMMEGVRAALDFPHDRDRFRIVAFLTDGYIGNEKDVLAEIRKHLGPARLFSFGVGSSVNRYLLEEMSKVGRGAVAYLALSEPDTTMVDQFFERVEHPAMTDLRIDWGQMGETDVYPDPIADLFVGRPVVLTGRFFGKARQALVRITGRVGGRYQEMALRVDLDEPHTEHRALASLWARAKIASLEEPRDIRDVALKYGLVSDYTAFVAVDSYSRTAGDHGVTVPVPVPVPAGVRYETTVERK